MKYDTIIIGGGLAGLTCGIKLARENKKCVIISSGQSALHFSSGSFDLLNALPDGTPVSNPLEGIKVLEAAYPEHPYAKIGKNRFSVLAQEAKQFLLENSIPVHGDADKNHYRITPLGAMKPTWLTINDFLTGNEPHLTQWKTAALFNIAGFLDFYPKFITNELKKMGIETTLIQINLPELKSLRKNPSELRSTNIARVLDNENSKEELADLLKKESKGHDVIILPACIGLNSENTVQELEKAVGKPIKLIATFPPSIPGIRSQQKLCKKFKELGGVYMLGDNVIKADINGNKIERIYTVNHGDIALEADHVILATGSFFSQGLIATPENVIEPIMNLDVDFAASRTEWYDPNLYNKQNYQSFGVKSDNNFRPFLHGETIENMYVTGAILNGFNGLKEGCGSGVSMLTALQVAHEILKK